MERIVILNDFKFLGPSWPFSNGDGAGGTELAGTELAGTELAWDGVAGTELAGRSWRDGNDPYRYFPSLLLIFLRLSGRLLVLPVMCLNNIPN